jgi:ferredoxin
MRENSGCIAIKAYGACRSKSCKTCHAQPGNAARIQAVAFARAGQPGSAVLGIDGPAR